MLSYDPETGVFIWLKRTGGQCKAGAPAGYLTRDGYPAITLDRRINLAHHLAFLLMTGRWPETLVDHIDGDRTNNRWSNLREVTCAVNSQNRFAARNKTRSAPLGVTWHKGAGKWQAQIRHNEKHYYLGLFDTPEAAHMAYLAKKAEVHPDASPR